MARRPSPNNGPANPAPTRFAEAVAGFRERLAVSDDTWKGMSEAARQKAFKVAGVAQLDVVSKVWKALDKAIADGETLADFKKRIGPELKKEWGGSVRNPGARLETIFRTNVQTAYSHGTWAQLQQPDTRRIRPYIKSVPILGDGRTSEICRTIGVVVLPAAHPWWLTHWAPLHFNALAAGTLVTTARGKVPIQHVRPGDLALTHRRRWRRVYAVMGKPATSPRVRRVHLSTGRVLSVTDEHPVLTTNGWKAAGHLQVGDVLFQHRQPDEGLGDVAVADPNDFPAPLDEPAIPFQVVCATLGPVVFLPVDFQGHSVVRKGKVQNVRPDDVLEDVRDAAVDQEAENQRLLRSGVLASAGGVALACLDADGVAGHGIHCLHSLRVPRHSGVGLLSQPPGPMRFSAGARDGSHGDCELGRLGPHDDAVFDAPPGEQSIAHVQAALDGTNGLHALPVALGDDGLHSVAAPHVEWIHAAIISLADVETTKDVWNLAVEEDETYLAEDVIVHNCRRTQTGLTEKQAQAQGVTQVPPAVAAATGFGRAPGMGGEWQPDVGDAPPELRTVYAAKPTQPEAPRLTEEARLPNGHVRGDSGALVEAELPHVAAALGDRLRVDGAAESELIREAVVDLGRLPVALLERAREATTDIHLGMGPVTGLGASGASKRLGGVKSDAHEGASWDEVGGIFLAGDGARGRRVREVLLSGDRAGGSDAGAIHELAHALDWLAKDAESPAFQGAWKAFTAGDFTYSSHPYFQVPGGYGQREAFAEAFAIYWRHGAGDFAERRVAEYFGPDIAAYVRQHYGRERWESQ